MKLTVSFWPSSESSFWFHSKKATLFFWLKHTPRFYQERRMFQAFENGITHFLHILEQRSWNRLPKKNKTKPSKLLKFKVGHRKLFRKSFWSVTWESNDLRVQKWHFSRFWKILSDKAEPVLCKAKRSKLLKSNVCKEAF